MEDILLQRAEAHRFWQCFILYKICAVICTHVSCWLYWDGEDWKEFGSSKPYIKPQTVILLRTWWKQPVSWIGSHQSIENADQGQSVSSFHPRGWTILTCFCSVQWKWVLTSRMTFKLWVIATLLNRTQFGLSWSAWDDMSDGVMPTQGSHWLRHCDICVMLGLVSHSTTQCHNLGLRWTCLWIYAGIDK